MRLLAFAVIGLAAGFVLGVLTGAAFDFGASDANASAADADLEVQSVTVAVPTSASASVPFSVALTAVVKNNGPFGPVAAPIDFTLSTPADCTANPGGPFQTVTSTLETGAGAHVSVTWSATCNSAGAHQFRGAATALAGSDNIYVDPNPGNNFGESTASVTITSSPVTEGAAKALPSSGGPPADGSSPWLPQNGALVAAISAAAVLLAVGGGCIRRRWPW